PACILEKEKALINKMLTRKTRKVIQGYMNNFLSENVKTSHRR
ncbi:1526_t:CDS:2, partial [Funneliformis caledonium]